MQDSTDVTVTLLMRKSEQLVRFSVNGGTVNSTMSFPTTLPPFEKPRFLIRVNIYWFSSLILSLLAAFTSITVKQWLQASTKDISAGPREAARIREPRYQSLLEWNVPTTIVSIPILVQLSVLLFVIGPLDLIWKLDNVVAGVGTGVTVVSMLPFFIFPILPF